MQYDYKYSMNGWSQVFTGVEFNCMTAMQGALPGYTSNLTNAVDQKKD